MKAALELPLLGLTNSFAPAAALGVTSLPSSKKEQNVVTDDAPGVRYLQKPVDLEKFRENVQPRLVYFLQVKHTPPALPSPAQKGRTS